MSLDPESKLALSASMTLRVTPAATLSIQMPHQRRLLEITEPQSAVLLAFSRPTTVPDAARRLAESGIGREEIEELVERWLDLEILTNIARHENLIRFKSFRRAIKLYIDRGRSGPFPLRSPFSLQKPDIYYPGLSATEVHDNALFPWVQDLEAMTDTVRQELEALLESRIGFHEVYKKTTSTGSWAAAYFWVYGRPVEETISACPETAAMLASIPGATSFSTTLFSVLGPRTNVSPHCGLTNAKLRCQLPLRLPPGCGLRIGDREAMLEEGRCVIFDDSFLHSAWNPSDKARFVLLFDFFHPGLTSFETDFLEEIIGAPEVQRSYLDELNRRSGGEWVYSTDGKAG